MHAPSLSATWHHWHDSVTHAFEPHPAHFDAESHRLSDNPIRARLRPVRLIPLAVPGMALVLVCCAMAIGWLMRY